MGGTGRLGGAREGARAAAARGAAARASGEELGKATVGNERGVSGRSVTRARGADAGASAKRGALVPAEGDQRRKSTRRRVGATEETTVDDLPVRLPSARLVVSPAPSFFPSSSFFSFDDDVGVRPARVRRVLTSPAPRDRRRATQDHLLEVIFGHLAADSKPREYFDAMLTCVPSLAFSSATPGETRAVVPRNQRDAVRDSTRHARGDVPVLFRVSRPFFCLKNKKQTRD
jgi:hypothetical protein